MAEVQGPSKSGGKSRKSKKNKQDGGSGGTKTSIMKRLSIGKIYKSAKRKSTHSSGPDEVDEVKSTSGEVEEAPKPPPPRPVPEPEVPVAPLAAPSSEEETLSFEHKEEEEEEEEVTHQEVLEEEHEEEQQQQQQQQQEVSSRDATTSTNSDSEAVSGGMKRECLYKILVIGELGAGKTSIIKRYVHQFFSQHYRATIGVDFALKVLNWDQNTIIRLQLWDIAGQERFGNMTRVYYKEAVGAFIVFDVTRSATFDAVLKWKQDLDSKVQLPDGSPIPCLLLANKCDQQKEGPVNNETKMNEFCKENNFTDWFLTSAKDNINIEDAAKRLVTEILKNDTSSENGRGGMKDTSRFPLEGHSDSNSERKSCSC